jgi:hypothetical protein
MAPHAAPGAFTRLVLGLTLAVVLLGNVGALPLVLGGGAIGLVRKSTAGERLTGFVPVLPR